MPSSTFVRGDLLSLVRTDAHSVSHKGFKPGDTVRVGGRKKGGWLRVRCMRTGDLVWIRSGRHLCLASLASRPASQIDLMIRENQVVNAEKLVEDTKRSLNEWKDAYYDAKTAYEMMKDAIDKRDTEISNIQSQNIEIMQQRCQLEGRLVQHLTENEHLKHALEREKHAHQEHAQMLEQELKETKDKLLAQIAELKQQRIVVSQESLGEYQEMQQADDEAMGFFDPNN